jgi:hypothetical protein
MSARRDVFSIKTQHEVQVQNRHMVQGVGRWQWSVQAHPEDLNGHRIPSFCNIFVNPRDQHGIEGPSQLQRRDVEIQHLFDAHMLILTTYLRILRLTLSMLIPIDGAFIVLASHDVSLRDGGLKRHLRQ